MLITAADLAYGLYPLVPFRIQCALARAQGRLQHRTRPEERAVVRGNLESLLGPDHDAGELDRLTMQAFEARQQRGLMLSLMPRLGPRRVERLLPMEGLEHVRAARAEGGAIILASHMNSLCNLMAIEILRARGDRVGVVMPTEVDPQPASRFGTLLERLGARPAFSERTGAFYAQFNVRPIVRRLSEGEDVLLVGDGWHSAAFVEVDFLGRRVYFTSGPMNLARSTGSTVVPMFVAGSPTRGLRVVFEEPISGDQSLDPRQDLERMVGRFAAGLERYVREDPACWQHCFERDALDAMAALPDTPLAERYAIQPKVRPASA